MSKDENMKERWLSVAEIAEHLGVNPDTIYKWIERKQLPAHKVGRLWKFMISEVDVWVRAGKAAERLRDSVAVRVQVLRDGRPGEVPLAGLVPGDIVLLAAGDLIPCDGRVLEAKDFFVKQALLTGEPYPVEKHAGDVVGRRARGGDAADAVVARDLHVGVRQRPRRPGIHQLHPHGRPPRLPDGRPRAGPLGTDGQHRQQGGGEGERRGEPSHTGPSI